MDARRFVERAQRVGAYGGVMAARLAQAEEDERPSPSHVPAAGPPGRGPAKHVDLAELRFTFPDVVSVTRATE